MSGVGPATGHNVVLSLMQQADHLATSFHQIHSSSLPALSHLQQQASLDGSFSLDSDAAEPALQVLRETLGKWEETVQRMSEMTYQVDIYLGEAQGVSKGQDPREALKHVGTLVDMYQSELLAKREALADATCEDISLQDFFAQWGSLGEVEQGKKQTMDDLADLLAGFG